MKKSRENVAIVDVKEMLIPNILKFDGGDPKKTVVLEKISEHRYKLLLGHNHFVAASNEDFSGDCDACVYSDLTEEEREHLYECVLTTECLLP